MGYDRQKLLSIAGVTDGGWTNDNDKNMISPRLVEDTGIYVDTNRSA